MIRGDTDYALSRLQARASRRLQPEQWRQISAARSIPALLEQLRAGSATRWVDGLGSCRDAHAVEAHLRARFGEQVEELASWAEPTWQPALRWCGRLVDLPLLRHAQINHLNPELTEWPAADRAPLQSAVAIDTANIDVAWRDELQRRLPPLDADERAAFVTLLRLLDDHRRRFSAQAAGNGWPEREGFQRRLQAWGRRNPLSPLQQLSAIALLWLDFERVRGELLRLIALPPELPS